MSVVPITSSFQSESPLHPKAAELLSEVFGRGWADPAKIHEPSRQLGRLLQEAKETFSAAFGVRSDEIYFLGEPPLGFHLGISGLLTPESCLYFSGTDRAPVHALVSHRRGQNLSALESVSEKGTSRDVLVYQPINPETGIFSPHPENFLGQVFVDNTAYGVHAKLQENWATSMWQSRSWQGPAGLGVIAIKNETSWRNPLPHTDASKVPQSFSIPLALASAVALEGFTADYNEARTRTNEFRERISRYLIQKIGDVTVVGEDLQTSPYLLSAIIAGIDSEKLVSDLNARGIAIDTGSACMSGSLAPSHVLAAMGLPVTGNIRITLHPQINNSDIENLLYHLRESILQQRN
ncbi:MAG: aminotransferase class V-fold PLP-dependent enzyme [Actinomycetes bacterium]